MKTPEEIEKMLKDLGLDTLPRLEIKHPETKHGNTTERAEVKRDNRALPPCANEEERQELREALGQLHYEGNFTDGFALKPNVNKRWQ